MKWDSTNCGVVFGFWVVSQLSWRASYRNTENFLLPWSDILGTWCPPNRWSMDQADHCSECFLGLYFKEIKRNSSSRRKGTPKNLAVKEVEARRNHASKHLICTGWTTSMYLIELVVIVVLLKMTCTGDDTWWLDLHVVVRGGIPLIITRWWWKKLCCWCVNMIL